MAHKKTLKMQNRIQKAETPVFFQFVGWALLIVCGFGLYSTFML